MNRPSFATLLTSVLPATLLATSLAAGSAVAAPPLRSTSCP